MDALSPGGDLGRHFIQQSCLVIKNVLNNKQQSENLTFLVSQKLIVNCTIKVKISFEILLIKF